MLAAKNMAISAACAPVVVDQDLSTLSALLSNYVVSQCNEAGKIENEVERFDSFCKDWNKCKNCNQRFVGNL